jgi:nicotinamidase-related amidase
MPETNTMQRSPAALVLIDVVSHFEFPDGDRLLENALPIAPRLARLKERARGAGIPVIYVNDNFGQWRSDAKQLLRYCLRPEATGRAFVEAIQPDDEDYIVLKPMHSAFYQTPMDVLLRCLGTSTLILCGLATNSCIVCTAHDAKMREFNLVVPADCSAARTEEEHDRAIEHIRTMTNADVSQSASLQLMDLVLKEERPQKARSALQGT